MSFLECMSVCVCVCINGREGGFGGEGGRGEG